MTDTIGEERLRVENWSKLNNAAMEKLGDLTQTGSGYKRYAETASANLQTKHAQAEGIIMPIYPDGYTIIQPGHDGYTHEGLNALHDVIEEYRYRLEDRFNKPNKTKGDNNVD